MVLWHGEAFSLVGKHHGLRKGWYVGPFEWGKHCCHQGGPEPRTQGFHTVLDATSSWVPISEMDSCLCCLSSAATEGVLALWFNPLLLHLVLCIFTFLSHYLLISFTTFFFFLICFTNFTQASSYLLERKQQLHCVVDLVVSRAHLHACKIFFMQWNEFCSI